jgi:RNA polymerase-binding protein DksA
MHARRRSAFQATTPLDTVAIERHLLERRAAILARVRRGESDLRELGAHVDPDRAEEAQEETTTDLLLRLGDVARCELQAIDGALTRLACGEYGACVSCGTTISPARLDVKPEATQCRECARTTRVDDRR